MQAPEMTLHDVCSRGDVENLVHKMVRMPKDMSGCQTSRGKDNEPNPHIKIPSTQQKLPPT